MPPLPKRLALVAAPALAALAAAFAQPAAAAPMSISVDPTQAGAPVPQEFLGLSYEDKALPDIASFAHKGNVVKLFRSLGHGIVRFGGVTADSQTAWTNDGQKRPAWANSTVGPGDLAALAQLVRATGWRALLTVTLGHYDPGAAADEASVARADLGDSLAGIEIGNEANAYANHGMRAKPWGFNEYANDVAAYRQAIDQAAPGVPLAGPGASSGHVDWVRDAANSIQPNLLTAHFYSLGCHGQFEPNISNLLGTVIRTRMSQTLPQFGAVSRGSGLPLRIDETNNVSCGGRRGVSDSFASALWASDLMLRAIDSGIAGVNFHGSIYNCHGYTPLCAPSDGALSSGTLQAQPEWYALLLVRRLLGDSPLRSFVRNQRQKVDVLTLARPGGGLNVLIVSELPHHDRPLPVELEVPKSYSGGTILRLTARLPSSTSGVRLGGTRVARDGSWRPAKLPHVGGKPGRLTMTMPAGTAALVTLR